MLRKKMGIREGTVCLKNESYVKYQELSVIENLLSDCLGTVHLWIAWFPLSLFVLKLFIYLFLDALGRHCLFVQAFSSCSKRGLLCCVRAVASRVAECRL